MPRLIFREYSVPYGVHSEITGWKWPDDTHEGRVARSEFAAMVRNGTGPVQACDAPTKIALMEASAQLNWFLAAEFFWLVRTPVKDLIEDLDGKLHQFFPIEVAHFHGGPYDDGTWWMLNVFAQQESVVDDLSDVKPATYCLETREHMKLRIGWKTVNLDESKLDPNIHIWREHRYLGQLFFSDPLCERLENMGVVQDFVRTKKV